MPAVLSSNNIADYYQPMAAWISGAAAAELRGQWYRHITIGLVNNMPDGALESTEKQFLTLLDGASGDLHIRLSLYTLPGIYRKGAAASHLATYYSGIGKLLNTHLDGIIVTGREPLSANLTDEPYWESFKQLVEWARENTYSSVWSCLAAHAAVLCGDGIGRVKGRNKHCGIFECSRVANHPLMDGIGPSVHLPHSRWNGVPESALRRQGYSVLTRNSDVGVDTFVKQYKSLFVFFQGHPEYDADTLLLEYRRDIGRYLRGESTSYPSAPKHYFRPETLAKLEALQKEAAGAPRRESYAELNEILRHEGTEKSWRSEAVWIYRNWLQHIALQKQLSSRLRGVASLVPIGHERLPIPLSGPTPAGVYRERRGDGREKQRRVVASR